MYVFFFKVMCSNETGFYVGIHIKFVQICISVLIKYGQVSKMNTLRNTVEKN